ncbi:MAG TPA: BON domain-containing protein [Labilithrix sp.]|nr:BON domain-containing protein [Labilithrix sp.]
MKAHLLVLSAVVLSTACGYRGQSPASEASYTTRTSKSTTVTVHPPPPEVVSQRSEPVGRTEITSAELVVDRRAAPVTASARPDASGGHPDRTMSDHIRRVLVSDRTLDDVSLERVRVTAQGGRVTLGGIVPTLADKVAIEQRVREVKGVEAVVNEIEVLH